MQKCCVFCFAKNKDATLTFCWCKNAFLQTKMLESGKMHFGVHFPKENVQHQQNVTNAFDAKMHFGVHFPKENVQLCKNAFDAKMHLMPKCILASNAFLHQMHFCTNKM